ncbi:hypothetical protein CHH83_08250 [Bacillus sp. 7586-K]|uniref:Exopolysaccharide biosynthesis protein n=1 Tax=Metabacillus niabensis TaxID=324854 RepID=A0ABT9YYK4_9BACI|nr:endolytic transglycosylase MltG [Metabacillus niabensis]MDQ0224865.1 exopolysaccharide biosynthesis protein [Metabacillus niabensis]PAD69394.1 hypothetical protein CHH83_08250 [Bacillus sp. 7586-K]
MSKTSFQAFAAGMIVATTLLGGTYLLTDNKSASADDKKQLTEKNVEKYLAENGRMAVEAEEYEELLAAKNSSEPKTDTAKDTKEDTAQKETTTETPAKEAPAEEKKEEPVTYNLTISEGMTTSTVSDLLEQNGIIEDSFQFDQYLIKNNYHQKVQLGTFQVKKGMDFHQLAEAITR